ncbi:MAG: c-type cytochrome [Lishizhenia sp.]
MKINFKAISKYTVAALTAVIAMSSCTSNPDSPGLEYMPDMYRSPAVETYVDYGQVRGTENEDWKMKQSALTPPNSTIPYYGSNSDEVSLMLPYHRKPSSIANTTHGLYDWERSDSTDTEAEYKASAADMNPLSVKTAEQRDAMFKTGKALYESKCQHCHGEKGNGQGPMVMSGAYAGVPDYTTLTELADGQVFYSIYYGKGAMGAHASLVNNKEIWTLVHYVNKFRNPDYLKDLPKEGENAVSVSDTVVSAVNSSENSVLLENKVESN